MASLGTKTGATDALSYLGYFDRLLAPLRTRKDWNDRFAHWERSESDSETQRIERARSMVQSALDESDWLSAQGVRVIPQGSFANRTNTRLDSDIDLRVQHPDLRIDYRGGVDRSLADRTGDYHSTGRTFVDLLIAMRSEIVRTLSEKFGRSAVDASGKKAIRVVGLEGSRAEVDVVPCFTLHQITATTYFGNTINEGIAILGLDGTWSHNFPDQHLANGRSKRLSSGLQFKRVVRTVKRLQADMLERGYTHAEVPSFLIECLIYCVEDPYFRVATDDRYDRIRRVLRRCGELMEVDLFAYLLNEVNGINPLFLGPHGWTLEEARRFVQTAITYLGDG